MLANWVMQGISSGGTGELVLGAVFPSYIAVNNIFNNGDEFFYTIEDGLNRETGIATYISSGNKVIRTQIFENLVNGVYDNTSPSPLSVSTSAKLAVTASVRGLTTNTPVWREIPANFHPSPNSADYTPTYKEFVVNINAYHFNKDISESLGVSFPVNTDIEVGAGVFLNIRWSPTNNTTGIVRWGVSLSVAEIDGTFTDAGVVYLEQAGSGVTSSHQLLETATKVLDAPNPNALVLGRVFRDSAHVNDTYAGDAVLHSVNLGYLSDKIGTPKRNRDHFNWG